MATSILEQQLTQMRESLEAQLERQQSKGGDVIVLTEEECEELFEIMKEAAAEIDGFVNGYA
jgi:hypothetical protein